MTKLKPVMSARYTSIIEALYEAGKAGKGCICIVEEDEDHYSTYGHIAVGICSYASLKTIEMLKELLLTHIKEAPEAVGQGLRKSTMKWHRILSKKLEQLIVDIGEKK